MVKQVIKSTRRKVIEAATGPATPLDKSLIEDKPKAILKGRDGGDVKVEKATWKKDKEDRRIAKRKAVLLKAVRQEQVDRKRFISPVKTMEEFEKEAILKENDNRTQRMRAKKTLRGRGKALFSNTSSQTSLILVVRNDVPFPGNANGSTIADWGLKKPFWACLKPNTTEVVKECEALKKFVFYGLPSSDVLTRIVMRNGSLWSTVDESTVDMFKAHRMGKKGFVNEKEDLLPINDNAELETRMGYLDVLTIEDLLSHLIDGTELDSVLKHIGPLRFTDLRKAKEDVLEDTRVKGIIASDQLDTILARI